MSLTVRINFANQEGKYRGKHRLGTILWADFTNFKRGREKLKFTRRGKSYNSESIKNSGKRTGGWALEKYLKFRFILKVLALRLTTRHWNTNLKKVVEARSFRGKADEWQIHDESSFLTHNDDQVPLTKKCVFAVSIFSIPRGNLNLD